MIEWKTSETRIKFTQAKNLMEKRVESIIAQQESELIWLLEHDPIYTAGTSASDSDLLDPDALPIYKVNRGGSYTYHGPGQRVVYLMLDLKNYGTDIRRFVWCLEEWLIISLAEFGILGHRRTGRVGIWIITSEGDVNKVGHTEKKIASIGLRIKKWISYYGVAVNIKPDLSHFNGIIPCGNKGFGVTSLHDLNIKVSLAEFDAVLKKNFSIAFEKKHMRS